MSERLIILNLFDLISKSRKSRVHKCQIGRFRSPENNRRYVVQYRHFQMQDFNIPRMLLF